jgi:outer membrane protein
MKKTIILFVLTIAISSAGFSQKFGHTNIQEVLLLLPERTTAETQVQELAKSLESRLQTMSTEYQAKVTKFQTEKATMSEVLQQSSYDEIVDLEKRIQEFQQQAQSEIQKKESELLEPMVGKINKAIEEVGKANNYTYIFDAGAGNLLYKGGEDVTPMIKKQLGL